MNNVIWITEYQMNGENYRFYTMGDKSGNTAAADACYNIAAVGEIGEETFKEIRTWSVPIDTQPGSLVNDIISFGYVIE